MDGGRGGGRVSLPPQCWGMSGGGGWVSQTRMKIEIKTEVEKRKKQTNVKIDEDRLSTDLWCGLGKGGSCITNEQLYMSLVLIIGL